MQYKFKSQNIGFWTPVFIQFWPRKDNNPFADSLVSNSTVGFLHSPIVVGYSTIK